MWVRGCHWGTVFQTSDRTQASQVWATEFGFCEQCRLMHYTPYPAHVYPSHIWTSLRHQHEKRKYEPQARILPPQTLKPEAQAQLLLFFFFFRSFNPMALNTGLPLSVTGSIASQFPRQSCFACLVFPGKFGSIQPCAWNFLVFCPCTAAKHLVHSRSRHHWASCCTYWFLRSGCLEAFLPSGTEEDR